MKKLTNSSGYASPEMDIVNVLPMSVLCQSGEGNDATLEDMTENDYPFTF